MRNIEQKVIEFVALFPHGTYSDILEVVLELSQSIN